MTQDENDIGGVIDFGDMVYSHSVYDLSICMAYAMMSPPEGVDQLAAGEAVLKGFSEVYQINPLELSCLRTMCACRMSTSVTLGAYSIS